MRCYEFYCAVLTNPTFCTDKSDRMEAYIYKYIAIMQENGVKFDKSLEDKELFKKLQNKDEVGSEGAATRPENEQVCTNVQISPKTDISTPQSTPILTGLTECSNCHMKTSQPQFLDNKPYCTSCYKEVSNKPTAKPKPELSIETKVLHAANWQENMHPTESKMDKEIYIKLQEIGVVARSQVPICILQVVPDILITKGNKSIAVFLDGTEVHADRIDRDMANRDLLAKRGFTVLSIPYANYSDAIRDNIIEEIMEAL